MCLDFHLTQWKSIVTAKRISSEVQDLHANTSELLFTYQNVRLHTWDQLLEVFRRADQETQEANQEALFVSETWRPQLFLEQASPSHEEFPTLFWQARRSLHVGSRFLRAVSLDDPFNSSSAYQT